MSPGASWEGLLATARAVRATAVEVAHDVPERRRRLRLPAVASALALTVGVAAARAGASPLRVAADSGADSALFSATNQDRSSNGVGPLTYNGTLQNVGEAYPYSCSGIHVQGRSYDMLQRNYFSHVIQGCNQYVFSMMSAAGVPYQSAGENIGWASGCSAPSGCVAYINTSFMNSPEHRANILNAGFTGMGVGTDWTAGPWSGGGSSVNNVSMFTELFVQQGSAAPPPPPRTPPPATSAPVVHATVPPAPVPVYSPSEPQPSPGLPPVDVTPAPTATPEAPEATAPAQRGGAQGTPEAGTVLLEPSSKGILGDTVESVLEGALM